MKKSVKEAAKSFSYIFFSQVISLVLSTIMSFLVPKLLGVEEFGFWQLFLFYSSYVGFFHFGMIDGIYLRYGGKLISQLNSNLIGSQFYILLFLELVLFFGIILFVLHSNLESNRQFVLIATSIFLIISNLSTFIGTIFQACNKLKVYAIATVVDKLIFIFFLIMLVIGTTNEYEYYIMGYITSKFIALIYLLFVGKSIIKVSRIDLKKSFKEFWDNISVGAFLMVSNIAGMLILGIGRFGIETFWGIKSFGTVSLYLTLTSFFLLFISQISLVLFPLLKSKEAERQKNIYLVGSDSLSLLLNGLLLFFPIIYIIVQVWLPGYFNGIQFFVLLFPLCLFDGKMQILFNTYMKVLRKEKQLLLFNLISIVIIFFLTAIGIILDNLEFVVASMTLAIIIRSVIAEKYLAKLFKLNSLRFYKDIIMNIGLAAVFCIVMLNLSIEFGMMIYLIAYLIYLFLQKKEIKNILHFYRSL